MALTKEQIHAAADQLAAAGTIPTLAAVRTAIGGGSYTTINEALKEWKAKQQAVVTTLREPTPEGISRQLDEVGSAIWSTALELANARLTSEREALEATRQQLETAQQEATELADQLSTEVEALQAQNRQTSDLLQAANLTLATLTQENATLSRQLATVEARAGETTKRAEDLKTELQYAHTVNTEQRQRHTVDVQALQATLNTTSEALTAKTAEAIRLQADLSHAQTQAQASQQQHQALQERHAHEIQRLNELNQAQAEQVQALQVTREKAAEQRGELEALRTQNTALLTALGQQSTLGQEPKPAKRTRTSTKAKPT